MKKRALRPHLLYLISIPIVAAVAVTLRTIALLGSYDAAIGRYDSQVLSMINGLFLLAVVGALAILTHELREMFVIKPRYRDLPTLFSGSFTAVALILFGITLATGIPSGETRYAAILAVLSGIMAVVGAILFILRAFDGTAHGGRFALLNLPIAVLGVSYPLYLSMRIDLRIADPAVIMATVTWVVIAFFFLGEARVALNRAMWALHTYITVLTVIFTATLAIPNLIYHPVNGTALLGNSEQDFAVLAIFLYALSRFCAIFCTVMHESTPTTRFAMGVASPVKESEKATDEETDA